MTSFIDIYFISFYVSILAIIGMIGSKYSEINSGKASIFSRLSPKINHTLRNYYYNLKKVTSYFNRKSVVALVQWIAYHILSWAREAYIWAHKKAHAHPPSKKVIDMVRGRGEIKRNGGVSFYLKRISEPEEIDEVVKKI